VTVERRLDDLPTNYHCPWCSSPATALLSEYVPKALERATASLA